MIWYEYYDCIGLLVASPVTGREDDVPQYTIRQNEAAVL